MSTPLGSRRYHALDCVRATAMLLGVFYHAIQFGGMSAGQFGPGSRGGASIRLQDWLHSFRMPLFFLIAGFFCAMMLGKYGVVGYLGRRWSRIGLPLVLGLFTVVPLSIAIRDMGGGPMGGGPRGGGPPGIRPQGPEGNLANLPPPPPGFVPPPFRRFDVDHDGTLSAEEWKTALEQRPMGGARGFGPGGSGPPGDDRADASTPSPFGPPGGGGMPAPGPPGFGPAAGGLGERIFGTSSRYFRLDYLWFLWYLLVFATIAPLVAGLAGLLASWTPADRLGRVAIRFGFAPLLLGLASGPALWMAPGFFGWSLGPASGIFRGVPDFLVHLEPDMPFYLAFFLAGWWLHRLRDGLPDLARRWLPCLAIGIAAHAGAEALSARYASQTDLPDYAWIRLGGYLLYATGSAYSAFGLLGFFQRFVNRPTRAGLYLADTAFWVYMVHQPILTPILRLVSPLGGPWLVQGLVVSALTAGVALVLYELVVVPTPLIRLFGPSGGTRPVDPGPTESEVEPEEAVPAS